MRWLHKLLGNRGERAAAKYLRRQGLRILRRNWQTRWGEIDLIARDGDTIVFVEVKTRASGVAGDGSEAVDALKQRHLTNAALAFLKQHGLLEHRSRFDVVTLLWPENAREPEIHHYRNAFPPVGFGQMYS